MKEASVEIAGKNYTLRYRLSDRREIEERCEKGLWAVITSGVLEDQATVVWAGLAHANRKLTPRGVIEMFEEHVEGGGNYQAICKKALWTMVDAQLLGDVNRAELVRILGSPDEEEPKVEAGNAVAAAQNV